MASKYNVGDVCRIRSWEDMCNEYDHTANTIRTPGATFIKGMECMCGKEFTVDKVYKFGCGYFYHSRERIEYLGGVSCIPFAISEGMLEPAPNTENEEDFVPDEAMLSSLLFG